MPGIDFSEEATKSAIGFFTNKVLESLLKLFQAKSSKEFGPRESAESATHINLYFNELSNWSKSIEFLVPLQRLRKDDFSVQLNISFNVRKLTVKNPLSEIISEHELLTESGHFVLLGDPGSGKTTTLKRLVAKYFFTQAHQSLDFGFPVLVKFRDMKAGETMYTYLADKLGIAYSVIRHNYTIDVQKERVVRAPIKKQNPDEEQKYESKVEKYIAQEERSRLEHYIGETKIELVLSTFLEANKVLLIMDGLDELPSAVGTDVIDDIAKLSYYLIDSKILITSRPDYVRRNLEGFKLCQICSLSDEQILAIGGLYKIDANLFFELIAAKPYFELARRPLFLSYLMLLYPNLPVSSSEVYRKIIDLILSWDQDRGFERSEIYAGFDFYKKRDFVSHLAFHLTFKFKKSSFSQYDLRNTYKLIYERFNLPTSDADLVCNELENHTGLIVKAFDKSYEFSHLSLQEYLCAYYLSSTIYSSKFMEYLRISPSAIAMSIALSQDANEWFNRMIFDLATSVDTKDLPEEEGAIIAKALLRKLLSEKPYFESQAELGHSILLISKFSDCADTEFCLLIRNFMHDKNVFKSVLMAINQYAQTRIDEKSAKVWFGGNYESSGVLATVALPLDVYNDFFRV